MPTRGAVVIETLEAGEVVGWSWLFAPYRWHFDARALSLVRATSFDGACLRGKAESDPKLGYALMSRFAQVMIAGCSGRACGSSTSTAMATAADAQTVAGPMVPQPFRVTKRRRELTDTWTLELEPAGGARVAARARPVHDAVCFGVGEVPVSVSGDVGRRRSSTRCARSGAVTQAICAAEPGEVLGVRGPFGNGWPVEAALGSDVVVVAGGIGLAPLRPAIYAGAGGSAASTATSRCSTAAAAPRTCSTAAELGQLRGRFDVQVDVTVDTAGAAGRARSGWCRS